MPDVTDLLCLKRLYQNAYAMLRFHEAGDDPRSGVLAHEMALDVGELGKALRTLGLTSNDLRTLEREA